MLGNESLWDAARACHELLERAGLRHALLGGVAVCLHGYRRNTVDVDLLVRRDEAPAIRSTLEAAGWTWIEDRRELRSPGGVGLQFLLAGDKAGRDSEVLLPDPGDEAAIINLEGLPVLSLARLIETKLACGQGNLRRTHKDFADVVELIARHELGRAFARHLHKSLRGAFRTLVAHAREGQ
ncbi:MAG: hypothetical protein DCC67_11380 [Planctomycetota bacterium]|nr:MAG: hypothetical protein DCC67_11380 [Planctomycetota bacterium]